MNNTPRVMKKFASLAKAKKRRESAKSIFKETENVA